MNGISVENEDEACASQRAGCRTAPSEQRTDRGFKLTRRAAMTTTESDPTGTAPAEAVSAPLHLLLTDATTGALNRLNPGVSGLRRAANLAARPRLIAGRGRQLLDEMARIAAGTVLRMPVFELIQYRPSTATAPRPGPTRRQLDRLSRMTPGPPERGHTAGYMRNMSVGGRVLRVAEREGNPAWPPLLLCNGIGASLELSQPVVDALDPRRPVIRFDMPGIGGSPAPVVPYHLHTLPPVLAGLLDELGHDRADVLGISWGGGLAQQFALSRPARVRRLVLAATATGALMVPGDPRVLLKILSPRRYQDRGYAARIAGDLYGGRARQDPAVARDLLHLTSNLGPTRGYFYQLLSSLGWTSLPHLRRLRQPTLILAGDDDPIIPLVNARIMHRLIPDSTLHVYSGGHLELAIDAERIVRVVEEFLGPGGAEDGTGR
jgi:poly(3-hydroxyalkanoate) depolymerase